MGIERRDKLVCLVAPPPTTARRVSECLVLLRGRTPVLLDDRFGVDLQDIITHEPQDRRPWDS